VKRVVVFEPYVGGFNTGDLIIKQAILKHLTQLKKDIQVYFVSLHQPVTQVQRRRLAKADLAIVAGSNMLTGRYRLPTRPNRWAISLLDIPVLKGKVVLCGVGWASPRYRTNPLGRFMYQSVLAKDVLHSVRDSYTLERVREDLGILNVLNTSCPTLWDVVASDIPERKGRKVVTTLTDYSPDPERDRQMLNVLLRRYEEVFFWPQGYNDWYYLSSLNVKGISVLDPALEAFDELLRSERELDYVGTRLHGGVRAMQHGRRTLIVSIDHRSASIARDVGLCVVSRSDATADTIESVIEGPIRLELRLPQDSISRWKESLAERLS